LHGVVPLSRGMMYLKDSEHKDHVTLNNTKRAI
jgi:hypothetical protein